MLCIKCAVRNKLVDFVNGLNTLICRRKFSCFIILKSHHLPDKLKFEFSFFWGWGLESLCVCVCVCRGEEGLIRYLS